ncbi:MAG: hypothetical protein ACRDNS_27145 [Trebonia sp.]
MLVAAATVALGLLAGCETQVPSDQFPEITFGQLPPIDLNVGRIEVVQQYHPPGKKPHVEHLFPVVPALAAERWARDRLKAVGTDGVARVVVVYAGVVEVPLKRTTGIEGMFTVDQSERYDGAIEIKIQIVNGQGQELDSVSTRAARSHSVPEDITLLGREKAWYQMTVAMMNDINTALEQQIKQNFSQWVVQGAAPGGVTPPAVPREGPVQTTPLQ